MIKYNYLLSVRLMTYNHESFIEDAIKGILMQETKFPFEVVVGDDFSSDSTLEKLNKFKSTDKVKIKILDRKKGDGYNKLRMKQGRLYNFIDILNNCSGKYIALLDGDDYWTDPLKLQKQVDYLENNLEYNATCHNTFIKNEIENEIIEKKNLGEDKDIEIQELALGNKIVTLTLVFRNNKDIIEKFKSFLISHKSTPVGDYLLNLLLSEKKKIRYFSQIMGVYRVHNNNIFSSSIYKDQKRIEICISMVSMIDNLKKLFNQKEIISLFIIQQKDHINEILRFRIKYIREKNKGSLIYVNNKLLLNSFIRKRLKYRLKISLVISLLLPGLILTLNKRITKNAYRLK